MAWSTTFFGFELEKWNMEQKWYSWLSDYGSYHKKTSGKPSKFNKNFILCQLELKSNNLRNKLGKQFGRKLNHGKKTKNKKSEKREK